MKKAINVVIVNDDNKILILKRSSAESHYPGLWDLPGGGIGGGENLKTAAEREVGEESGLQVKIDSDYFYVFRSNAGSKIEAYAFKASLSGGEVLLSKEHTEFKWISKNEYKNFQYTPSVTSMLNEFFKNGIF